jgi:hypothetical protein
MSPKTMADEGYRLNHDGEHGRAVILLFSAARAYRRAGQHGEADACDRDACAIAGFYLPQSDAV